MNKETEDALKKMYVIKKIVNSEINDLSKYYILSWYNSGWRDENWVDYEIEFRKNCPIQELKQSKYGF